MGIDTYRKTIGAFWGYNLLVILWGAWVRISKSGDGCGEHWPLCDGQFIPKSQEVATWIEFSHRLSTGLYGIVVVVLTVLAFRTFFRGHIVRKLSVLMLFFTITEALIGAGLVLKGLVGDNESLARAYAMGVHQINSLLLTGSIVATFQYSKQNVFQFLSTHLLEKKLFGWLTIIGFLFISTAGAFAALSGTLYPADSLVDGLLSDLNRDSHILVRLRVWHPLLATLIGGFIAYYLFLLSRNFELKEMRERSFQAFSIFVFGLIFGAITLFSLSPTWMKLTHLAMAHIVWSAVGLVIFPIIFGRRSA